MRLAHVRVAGAGLVVHAWASPKGVCATFVGEPPGEGVTAGGRPVEGVEIVEADERLVELAAALERYLAGMPLAWGGPLDLRGTSAFQREVFDVVLAIPWGEVRRYREVAGGVGRPRAVRAVGSALRGNPLPVLVPCHRVVSSRSLGGYAAGTRVKRRLLEIEAGQARLPWGDVE